MFRIDHPTAVAAPPTPSAPGTPGYFTKGDPVGGIPATVVTDEWANSVQEEIANVIEGAGITLDKADSSQLLAAITELITASLAPNASESTAGIIKIATALLAQELTDDTTALTPKKLADAFKGANQILAGNGMQKVPGGFIIQSLFVANNNSLGTGYSRHTWPQAFPNGVTAVACASLTGAPNFTLRHVAYANTTKTHIDWVVYDAAGAPTSTAVQANFIALGY